MDLPTDVETAVPAAPRWPERLLALLEVGAAAVLGGAMAEVTLRLAGLDLTRVFQETDVLFAFLIAESTFTLLLIALLLRARGESFSLLSPRPRRLSRETLIGLAILPVLFAMLLAVTAFFLLFLPDWVTESNPILELIQTPRDLALFLISSLFVGGVKEEIQRAFVLDRFERFLGGARWGLVLWSLFFGLGHLAQGPDNAVKAAGLGLVFGVLYLRRRHLAAPVVCHAAFDVVAVLSFWFLIR